MGNAGSFGLESVQVVFFPSVPVELDLEQLAKESMEAPELRIERKPGLERLFVSAEGWHVVFSSMAGQRLDFTVSPAMTPRDLTPLSVPGTEDVEELFRQCASLCAKVGDRFGPLVRAGVVAMGSRAFETALAAQQAFQSAVPVEFKLEGEMEDLAFQFNQKSQGDTLDVKLNNLRAWQVAQQQGVNVGAGGVQVFESYVMKVTADINNAVAAAGVNAQVIEGEVARQLVDELLARAEGFMKEAAS